MKVLFVNWTKPFFERNNFNGHKKYSTPDIEGQSYSLPDYEIIMQIASITSAKIKTGLPVKLITDNVGKKYYEKIGILDLFDEVDTNTLEYVNEEYEINPAQFWTSGKIISICKETPPFIFMDLDLILKSPLEDWIFNYDVVHTHWELLRSYLYIQKDMVDFFELNLPKFDERMLIPNTSFLFINNKKVLEDYLEQHLEIVTKKYDIVHDWLWLMSDQHILGYTIRDLNSKVTSFHDKTYIQYPDIVEGLPGYLPEWVHFPQKYEEKPLVFEHVWLDKSNIINNHSFRTIKLAEWVNIITENGFAHKLVGII
jgi:hypothetical protein